MEFEALARAPLVGGRRISGGSRETPPLVSIVVVVFRALRTLAPLLDSIWANAADDTELVVIDGGSDDGTVEFLQRATSKIDFWSSEPDRGIYDAMNKGIKASTGTFILHLNSGDRLKAIPRAQLHDCIDDGTAVACFPVLMDNAYVFRPRTGLIMKIDNGWHHQGTFYRRLSHPGYDLRYRVFADFDLNQRLVLGGSKVRLFDEIVAEHTTDGISSSNSRRHEVYRIVRRNHGLRFLLLASIRFGLNSIRKRAKRRSSGAVIP
jgi:glycosyltransferase involved in cell wall biosynthesis